MANSTDAVTAILTLLKTASFSFVTPGGTETSRPRRHVCGYLFSFSLKRFTALRVYKGKVFGVTLLFDVIILCANFVYATLSPKRQHLIRRQNQKSAGFNLSRRTFYMRPDA